MENYLDIVCQSVERGDDKQVIKIVKEALAEPLVSSQLIVQPIPTYKAS